MPTNIRYVLRPGQTIIVSVNIPRGKRGWDTARIDLNFDPALAIQPMQRTVTSNGHPFVHVVFRTQIGEMKKPLTGVESLAQLTWRVDDNLPKACGFGRAVICTESDVHLEYVIACLLGKMDFVARRLGGPLKPDIIAKRMSHPDVVIDIEATVEERYDLQKYGYDLAKYSSYKKTCGVNRLLIVYASKELERRVEIDLRNQKSDVSGMSAEQFFYLYKQISLKTMDMDSAFAKIIRPGLSDVVPTVSAETWLFRPICIRFEVDPDWRVSVQQSRIRMVPLVELETLAQVLVQASARGSETVYDSQIRTQSGATAAVAEISECVGVLKLIGAVESDVVTEVGRELVNAYQSSERRFLGKLVWLIYERAGGSVVLNKLRQIQKELIHKRERISISKIVGSISQALIDEGYYYSIQEARSFSESILKWLQVGGLVGAWDSARGYLMINEAVVSEIQEQQGFRDPTIDDQKYLRGELR